MYIQKYLMIQLMISPPFTGESVKGGLSWDIVMNLKKAIELSA